MRKAIILTIFLITALFTEAYAAQYEGGEILEKQMEMLPIEDVKRSIDRSGAAFELNFASLIKSAVAGELDLSLKSITSGFLRLIFNEIYQSAGLLKELFLIGILSAVLKALTDSFKNKSVGEMGFYISYIALIMVLLVSFRTAMGVLSDMIYVLSDFISASIPLMVSLIVMGGNAGGGYAFNTVLLFSINLCVGIVKNIILPLIMVTATANVVNYLGENQTLSNLAKLIKDIISWSLKALAIMFTAVLSIQRISSPILNNIAVKTAKSAVDIVPVVGEVLVGAVDTIMYWSAALKSGAGVAILISACAICAVPIIKLLAFWFIYKVSAAIIQPVCDKRVAECINAIGDYVSLMLSAGFIVVFMFVFSVLIMLSF